MFFDFESGLGLRTLFLFLPSIILTSPQFSKKIPAKLLSISWWTFCCNRPFSCQFWLGNITYYQELKTLAASSKFPNGSIIWEGNKGLCTYGQYSIQLATIRAQKLTSWGHKWISIKFHHILLFFRYYSFPGYLFSKSFWHNVRRPIRVRN